MRGVEKTFNVNATACWQQGVCSLVHSSREHTPGHLSSSWSKVVDGLSKWVINNHIEMSFIFSLSYKYSCCKEQKRFLFKFSVDLAVLCVTINILTFITISFGVFLWNKPTNIVILCSIRVSEVNTEIKLVKYWTIQNHNYTTDEVRYLFT